MRHFHGTHITFRITRTYTLALLHFELKAKAIMEDIRAVNAPSDFTITGYDGTSVTVRPPAEAPFDSVYNILPGATLHCNRREVAKLVRDLTASHQKQMRMSCKKSAWTIRPIGYNCSFEVHWDMHAMTFGGVTLPVYGARLVLTIRITVSCRNKRGRFTGVSTLPVPVYISDAGINHCISNAINLRRCPSVISHWNDTTYAESIPDHVIVLACAALSRSLPVHLPHVVAKTVGLALADADMWDAIRISDACFDSIHCMGVDDVVDFAQALATAYRLNMVADVRQCIRDALGNYRNNRNRFERMHE
jgi:hypothetical protein